MKDIECLCCHEPKNRDEMSTMQSSKMQVCTSCSNDIRAVNRAERRRVSEATMAHRISLKRADENGERRVRSDTRLSGQVARKSKMLEVDRIIAKLKDDKAIADMFAI